MRASTIGSSRGVNPAGPCAMRLTGSAGLPGDAATRAEPKPAITADNPRIRHEDHDLRLENFKAIRIRCASLPVL